MKPKLLIFTYHQFGYHIDTLKYCQYARQCYDITYIGWNYNRPKINLPAVNVIYVSRVGNIVRRNLNLLTTLHNEIRNGDYHAVFALYVRGISIVRLLNLKQKTVFDIRTLSVERNIVKRLTFNFFLRAESLFFANHSVISEGLAKKIFLKNYFLLPLGSDPIVTEERPVLSSKKLKILYVGTLHNRDIIKCVIGLHKYMEMSGDSEVSMTIIGDSPGNELEEILKYISSVPLLHGKIQCLGRVKYTNLPSHFADANVGLAFIPITSWYNHQPPTKTFEYLLSNLRIIATRTLENERLLESVQRAILINDTTEEVTRALFEMKMVLENTQISTSLDMFKKYLWENIVKEIFIPIINKAK